MNKHIENGNIVLAAQASFIEKAYNGEYIAKLGNYNTKMGKTDSLRSSKTAIKVIYWKASIPTFIAVLLGLNDSVLFIFALMGLIDG